MANESIQHLRKDLPAALRSQAIAVPHACKEFAHSVAISLMQSDVAATNSLAQAIDRGDRLLVAIDVDTADSELRVLSVAPNQRITQHAAFGLIAPSDARN
ncbi:hypothetical protein VDP97_08990 [Xanthomonas campestris pv. campestris]|uniref:Uncharacterized protein n=1 Tax=Xanthomonas campestris pv. campestris (strain B100) TaxID=509169 RepID=B0RYH1_XANCB|nr:hypothetical protein [Xanthomonas campestris]MDO0842132.1 hypothetical protein [Xanthomonas campestris pv. campestris]MEA0675461.1 hypothetical protein [Xanthomonas campestris pv. campestris]MEA0689512.1 hypothetical protein [Xanthomonas campestris pv. campestris]MEA0694712.1 hypothetical protein [Xanthomonas campestris pv. campestris]MEA0766944.1 hypothetical protein [Xanthomonas campestris pv. campestris]